MKNEPFELRIYFYVALALRLISPHPAILQCRYIMREGGASNSVLSFWWSFWRRGLKGSVAIDHIFLVAFSLNYPQGAKFELIGLSFALEVEGESLFPCLPVHTWCSTVQNKGDGKRESLFSSQRL